MPKEKFRVQARLELAGPVGDHEEGEHVFCAQVSETQSAVVEIDLLQKHIWSGGDFSLTHQAHEALTDETGKSTDSRIVKCERMWDELRAIKKELTHAIEQVLAGLKYYFNRHELPDYSTANEFYWERFEENYVKLQLPLRYIASVKQCIYLDAESTSDLQAFLDGNKKMLTSGLRHLHRAHNEQDPTFKWIDATIAAELAIKECIIFLKPELATLLLEMPSPPLTKLYGLILESVTGRRSSKCTAIRKGIETRNRLIHRPGEEQIDIEKATQYLDDIEIAIFELLSFMYPEDKIRFLANAYASRSDDELCTGQTFMAGHRIATFPR